MVTIRKGNEVKKVPLSTFSNFFKNNGWVIDGEAKTSPAPVVKEVKKEEKKVEEPVEEVVEETPEEEVSEDEWDEALEEMQDDEVEKPISEMNKNELIEKAKQLGINVSNGASNKELRDLIKASK